jgi:capsular polysaccharide biosynthesis protein
MIAKDIRYLSHEEISRLSNGRKMSELHIGGLDFYHCKGSFVHVYSKGFVCFSTVGATYAAKDSFNYARGDFLVKNKIDKGDIVTCNTTCIEGLCISLATPWSFNFFHWIEELTKACWLEVNGVYPNYIIPNNSPIYSESLQLLGIPESRIVSVNGSNLSFRECILSPQINFHPRINFKPLLVHLQRFIYSIPRSETSSAPCFILRRQGGITFSNRELMNSDEVVDFCDRRGIEYFDPSEMSFADQVAAFRNRKMLLGIHGAGFCHQIWMKQRSCIIEILSPKYIHFTTLNLANALDNYYFMCTQDSRGVASKGSTPEKIYANIDLMENIFKSAGKLLS